MPWQGFFAQYKKSQKLLKNQGKSMVAVSRFARWKKALGNAFHLL